MSNFINITEEQIQNYNKVVNHPLQSYEWGEFRKKTGIKVVRQGLVKNGKITDGFTLTIHKVPHTKYHIGYLPKGILPTKEIIDELYRIGKQENCIYIQLEPNVEKIENCKLKIVNLGLRPSFHPLFTKYTFILDLDKSEEELLKNMNSKSRYNIKVAQKHKVWIEEDNSQQAFDDYLRLTFETTKRQKFYAHTEKYHRLMWETLKVQNSEFRIQNSYNDLTAHLMLAKYQPMSDEQLSTYDQRPKTNSQKPTTLATWILFVFHDTLYYPYGASSDKHRNTMASNLIMWEAIKFGKKLGLKKFDMWGALGPNSDKNDPWYGFHRFKEGYGATLTEFVGSYDLVINPLLYQILKAGDKARWFYLRLKK